MINSFNFCVRMKANNLDQANKPFYCFNYINKNFTLNCKRNINIFKFQAKFRFKKKMRNYCMNNFLY